MECSDSRELACSCAVLSADRAWVYVESPTVWVADLEPLSGQRRDKPSHTATPSSHLDRGQRSDVSHACAQCTRCVSCV